MKAETYASRGFILKGVTFLLLLALLGGILSAGMSQTAYAESETLSAPDLYEQNVASTVGITISAETTSIYGYGYTYKATGSGFIISNDGYILTNYHVINGYQTVTVATYDQKTYDAEVIGYDESSDIAVLKIDAENLTPVKMGDSNALRVGETVYAIGNPLGELTFSLTKGIVSALSRNIQTGSGASIGLIQTDCAINSGNSGGALFNDKGEVIGITNAKYSASGYASEAEIDNIGFAIPINSAKRIVTSIVENGYVLKPYIGVVIGPLSDDVASITGIESGVVVQEVTEGAPAAEAGIKVNDVIFKVNSKVIHDTAELVQIVSESDPGDYLTFHIYRQGKEIQVEVEVGSQTTSAMQHEEETAEAEDQQQNQPSQEWQGRPDQGEGSFSWGDVPMEEFFRYFFGR